jgi:hypothetical protein
MKQRSHRPLVVILCALACATAAVLSIWPSAGYVRTEDRNGDGRPDVWRVYDRRGQLSKVAIDTNLDGRSDVQEYYERGALVRRESDRNFDDRVDLVEEFDPTTHEEVRSTVDVDFDGIADLLVLFQEGHGVFSKWAHPPTPATARGSSAPKAYASQPTANDLAPLEDPFRADLAIGLANVAASSDDCVELSTSGGLPVHRYEVGNPLASSYGPELIGPRPSPSTILDPLSSRGPPVSSS